MKLKEDYIDEIQAMIKNGETKANIAQHFNITRQGLYKFIKKYGIDREKPIKQMHNPSPEEWKIIKYVVGCTVGKAKGVDKMELESYLYEKILTTYPNDGFNPEVNDLEWWLFGKCKLRLLDYVRKHKQSTNALDRMGNISYEDIQESIMAEENNFLEYQNEYESVIESANEFIEW